MLLHVTPPLLRVAVMLPVLPLLGLFLVSPGDLHPHSSSELFFLAIHCTRPISLSGLKA